MECLVKYFHTVFARIWFVDRGEMKNLILKFSVGKYKNIYIVNFLRSPETPFWK